MKEDKKNNRILLILMPFWTPLIPPMGICSIKSYLENHDYIVKTVDSNVNDKYREIYYEYFDTIKSYIPQEMWGNYYSIGTDVLRNHLMAHMNKKDLNKYSELVKILIYNTYYYDCNNELVSSLIAIIDKFYKWEKSFLLEILEREQPNFFGLSVNKDCLPASLYAFKLVKTHYPNIKTIMGGSVFSEQLTLHSSDFERFKELTEGFIDNIIIGPGEETMLHFLNDNAPKQNRILIKSDIVPDNNSSFEHPIPDYTDMDLDHYPFIGALGSIGCQYNCSFCNVVKYFGKFKYKEPAQLSMELETLYRKYKKQLFFMADNMVNPFITELAKERENAEIALYWSAYLRVDDEGLDQDKVMQWRKGGFYSARLGTDSGSQRILDIMDKRIRVETSKAMIRNLAEAGIKTTTYWLIGHPQETEEDFQLTLDFLSEMKDYIWEAECEYFNYNYTGQSHSDDWSKIRKLVYPEWARDMLVVDKWDLDCDPSREVIFSRVRRFVSKCNELGIPNPYSLKELYLADKRWKRLYSNAVPAITEFEKDVYIDDRKNVRDFGKKINKNVKIEINDFNL